MIKFLELSVFITCGNILTIPSYGSMFLKTFLILQLLFGFCISLFEIAEGNKIVLKKLVRLKNGVNKLEESDRKPEALFFASLEVEDLRILTEMCEI